jgi:hypothetical protein
VRYEIRAAATSMRATKQSEPPPISGWNAPLETGRSIEFVSPAR